MKVLICPDSYKGCMSSTEVCAAMRSGIKNVSNEIEIMQFPSSDGGEGFCDCMQNLFGGEYIELSVKAPLGNTVKSKYLYISNTKTAFIELAAASGLSLVPKEKRDILRSSSYGTGELILDAVKNGAKIVYIGIGGSATNDCGIGLLSALGMRFFDESGEPLEPIAYNLSNVFSVDKSKMLDISDVRLIAACDVNNPLCGELGAAKIFARQKSATEEEIQFLDESARTFATTLGIDPNVEGSGAAGGVGAALISVLGAEYISGASLLVESARFSSSLLRADVVITGEGNTDKQSLYGKLVGKVLDTSFKNDKNIIVISGGLSEEIRKNTRLKNAKLYALTDVVKSVEYCISNASALIKTIAEKAILEYHKNNGSV